MSATLNLPFVRFTRQYHTEAAANTMWLATLADAIAGLKAAPWQMADSGIKIGMPISDPTATFESQTYDAFKASGNAASSKQAAYVGMVCYRFKLPTDAFAGTPANIASVDIKAYADKFLWKGLRISAYRSDSESPSTDWDFLRAGDVATPVDAGGAGVLPEPNPATKLASNKDGTFTLAPVTALTPQAYLFVIVQLEAWAANKYEYWIEGSGMVAGAAVSVTFDRSVEPDAVDATFTFPVTKEDLYEPSRVYPLDFLASEYNRIILSEGYTATVPLDLQLAVKVVGNHGSSNFSLALKSDGTVLAWGDNTHNQVSGIPSGLSGVVDIACKSNHCLALKSDGTVVGWGDNTYAQTTIPAGLSGVIAIAAGTDHSLALKSTGIVVAWGTNGEGQTAIPAGLTGVVGIDAAEDTSVAVKSDGTVFAWGRNVEGQCNVTAGLTRVTSVCCGGAFCVALKSDGTVVGWGDNGYGVHTTGLSNVVALSAHRYMTIAIKADGTMAKFGTGSQTFPTGLANVVSVTAGPYVSYVVARLATAENPVLWEENVIRSSKMPTAFLAATVNDADAQRKVVLGRAVANASAIVSSRTDAGQFRISNAGDYFEMSAAVCGFRYTSSATNSAPNKIHVSLPTLASGAYGETYLRVMLLKDTNATAVNPANTLTNWRTLWRGGVPTGYTYLSGAKIRHEGFVNSVILPMPTSPGDGVVWLVVIPIYAPLAGDSLDWNITQTGFDASRVFMLRV